MDVISDKEVPFVDNFDQNKKIVQVELNFMFLSVYLFISILLLTKCSRDEIIRRKILY